MQLESLTSDVKAKERAEGFAKDGESEPAARKERAAVTGGDVSGVKKKLESAAEEEAARKKEADDAKIRKEEEDARAKAAVRA